MGRFSTTKAGRWMRLGIGRLEFDRRETMSFCSLPSVGAGENSMAPQSIPRLRSEISVTSLCSEAMLKSPQSSGPGAAANRPPNCKRLVCPFRHNRFFPSNPSSTMNLRALSAVAAATLFASLLPSISARADDASAEHWVSAWSTALQALPQRADLPALYRAPAIGGPTGRQIVYPAIDGRPVRLRFSNVYGTTPLVIEGVQVARAVSGNAAATRAGTTRSVTFGGKQGVTIAPGGQMDSDPIAFDVTAHQPLAAST